MDVSKQVIELRRPQCRCGFIFDSCVVESLLVDSDDILASYTSMQKGEQGFSNESFSLFLHQVQGQSTAVLRNVKR